MNTSTTKAAIQCDHCGDSCPVMPVRHAEKSFCCQGCKNVYLLLQENDLCDYYALNDHPGIHQGQTIREGKFAVLDHAEVNARFIRFQNDREAHVDFYLPQMHCSSCLWLLENIQRINKGILSSRVEFTAKEIHLVFDPRVTSLRKVAETLASVGYEPHLNLDTVTDQSLKTIDRTRWYKIGVAGFCFSNIMMLSFPEYLSGEGAVEPALAKALSWISVGLSLPVMFYAAQEFFVNAWNGLKNRYLNIDAPVALALLLTFGRSLYEITSGSGTGYLDSFSGIVFFMLIGRWLQDKTYRTISFDRDYKSFFPIAVEVVRNGTTETVPVDHIRIQDTIRIHHGELIPVDALLSKGTASIDYSFVTGESLPVEAAKGEIIYAGGRQTGGVIELVVVKEVAQSYLTHLWNRKTKNERDTGPGCFCRSME